MAGPATASARRTSSALAAAAGRAWRVPSRIQSITRSQVSGFEGFRVLTFCCAAECSLRSMGHRSMLLAVKERQVLTPTEGTCFQNGTPKENLL